MTEYNRFERFIARSLETFPSVRTVVKELYKRSIYLVSASPRSRCILHPEAGLKTPHEWAHLPEPGVGCFFGYYDKSPWSKDMNKALFHRPVSGRVELIVLDRPLARQESIGVSEAWNWQQGTMARWLPGQTGHRVIFNDIVDDVLGSKTVDLDTGTTRSIEWPIQAVHPGGLESNNQGR